MVIAYLDVDDDNFSLLSSYQNTYQYLIHPQVFIILEILKKTELANGIQYSVGESVHPGCHSA
jgi:hypothetical protein